MRWLILLWAIAILGMSSAFADPLNLVLPTPNRALLEGDLPSFFMYVDRYVGGKKTRPWEGGQYGYVRTPSTIGGRTVYKHFHEGIDIKPARCDDTGEPLDDVVAIADGTVAHANLVSSHSNYGRYVVIEHRWDGCPYYSLYAHLKSVSVKPGDRVKAGDPLGRLGYTGRGINRRRAHLHLEINLMLSSEFESWHDVVYPSDENYHGLYNGLNLVGFDAAAFYLARRHNANLTVPQFLSRHEAAFRVIVPTSPHFTLVKRYPWLLRGQSITRARAWQITFDEGTVPIRVDPIDTPVNGAKLVWAKPSRIPYRYISRGFLRGSGSSPALARNGEANLRLISPYK
jgi:murein DD-endopeptidase MepM/ murein hydrolase activator NlpD